MAQRRCLQTLNRHGSSLLSSNPSSQSFKTLPHLLQTLALSDPQPFQNLTVQNPQHLHNLNPISASHFHLGTRHFSSKRPDDTDDEEYDEGDEDEEDSDGEEEEDDDDETANENVSNCAVKRVYTVEEKEKEAEAIGYKVIGPLQRSDRVFKSYEPAFAVVQIGSHQFKVSNGDCIYTERLKFCEVNDKLILSKVLLLGSSTQTIVGRPTLPDATVHAVVEEHALDAKVIIFKKKRRKNYRRTKGHRQELTKLRITNIEGVEVPEQTPPGKPEKTTSGKSEKLTAKKPEKVAVAA